jgi:hypothetical protein
VRISSCDTGLENNGSLILGFYDCDFVSNVNGYISRKASTIYCNLVNFFGGSFRSNSAWGMDVGDTNGLYLYGVDIEGNGTANGSGDGTGGAIIIRDTCDDEVGYSIIGIHSTWFEGNNGTAISVEACQGLSLSISDTNILSTEDGNAITCGLIGGLSMDRVIAGSLGDTADISAYILSIKDSTIHTLVNGATRWTFENLSTGSGFTSYEVGRTDASDGVTFDKIKTARASVSAPSGVATTVHTASGSGLYIVYAFIAGVGPAYMANARIGRDGANTSRIGGEDGTNLTITVSGDDIQVRQTSGVTQLIEYVVQKVA